MGEPAQVRPERSGWRHVLTFRSFSYLLRRCKEVERTRRAVRPTVIGEPQEPRQKRIEVGGAHTTNFSEVFEHLVGALDVHILKPELLGGYVERRSILVALSTT